MYIESSAGYTKKRGGRSHTATAYGPDSIMTGTHWSGASLKNKTRKTLVNQPQSVPQLSAMANISQKQQLDFRSLNGSLPLNNNQFHFLKRDSSFVCSSSLGPNTTVTEREWVDDLRKKSIPEIQTAQTSLDLLYAPHPLTKNILNNNNNTTINITTSSGTTFSNNNNGKEMCYSNEPKESRSLSNDIALRIKEKFDQRVSKHLSKSKQKTKSNIYTYTSQYHLLAVFLVNKGNVEAWYAYAPMPNHYSNQQNELGHTRLLELTQRRLRLLQRYYSDSRQYVVLYVNNNNSEHYLPMGLVSDVNSKPSRNKSHTLSINRELFQRDRSIYRFINSLLPNKMKFVNTTGNNNSSDKQTIVDKKVNSTLSINDEKLTNKIEENQHQLRRQQQQQTNNNQIEEKQFSETEQLVKATNSINHRPNLWTRLLEHFISHHQSTESSTISSNKNSYKDDDNNNNSINVDRENCPDNTNEKFDFKCYVKCLHLDSCLVKQFSTCTEKADKPVTPTSTTITMNVTKNVYKNNFNIDQCSEHDENNYRSMKQKDCLTSFKTKTTNDDLSSVHQICTDDKLSDVSKYYADSQQNIDIKDDQEKCEIKQIKKLSDCKEIWLPKFYDL
ncbi:unnamed protein product [Schistosoma rodhaini]|uniref:Uncharacterized protein n=1 Tax=Schistosoma rodhaini TaxID=6188 RepID=A0AA85F8E8_9TREM|nr:unnamed protein product [Schistosoma rodhaini]